MLRSRVIAFAFVLGLLATPAASGQPNPVQPTRLALEVYFYPGEPPAYVVVAPSAFPPSGAWFARFSRVPGWTAPAGALPVGAVNFRPVLAGDVIRVSISVLCGNLLEQEKDVAVYTLREGQKASVRELTQFGVEPIQVALIRVPPDNAEIPQVISKAKSIELVTVQANLSTLPSHRVVLRNLSEKNVAALMVRVAQGGRTRISGMRMGKDGAPLIAPGGVSEITVRLATRATETPGGYKPITPENQIIEISTAVFEDGSFEGDIEYAVIYRTVTTGEKLQLKRVVALFQAAAVDDVPDPLRALESLENKLAGLGIEADAFAVQEVMKPFSALPEASRRELKSKIEVEMNDFRKSVLEDVAKFRLGNPNLDATAFRAWLVASKQRYEAWLARL